MPPGFLLETSLLLGQLVSWPHHSDWYQPTLARLSHHATLHMLNGSYQASGLDRFLEVGAPFGLIPRGDLG